MPAATDSTQGICAPPANNISGMLSSLAGHWTQFHQHWEQFPCPHAAAAPDANHVRILPLPLAHVPPDKTMMGFVHGVMQVHQHLDWSPPLSTGSCSARCQPCENSSSTAGSCSARTLPCNNSSFTTGSCIARCCPCNNSSFTTNPQFCCSCCGVSRASPFFSDPRGSTGVCGHKC